MHGIVERCPYPIRGVFSSKNPLISRGRNSRYGSEGAIAPWQACPAAAPTELRARLAVAGGRVGLSNRRRPVGRRPRSIGWRTEDYGDRHINKRATILLHVDAGFAVARSS